MSEEEEEEEEELKLRRKSLKESDDEDDEDMNGNPTKEQELQSKINETVEIPDVNNLELKVEKVSGETNNETSKYENTKEEHLSLRKEEIEEDITEEVTEDQIEPHFTHSDSSTELLPHNELPAKKRQKEEEHIVDPLSQKVNVYSGNNSLVMRDFEDNFIVHVKLKQPVLTPEHERLLLNLPDSGFGTIPDPDPYVDHIYPACSLLLLGFFFLVPWVFGTLYLRSRNTTARTAGILSLILTLASTVVILVVIFTRH